MSHTMDSYDAHIERIRRSEYPQLLNTTYLDHAGTTLYARSLIDAFHADLVENLYGNPHSVSPASDLSTRNVDKARLAVLEYFNASHDDFDIVFTANASAALKLVGDCFRDQNFEYVYHKDVHTSVVGLRELSQSPAECLASDEDVLHWIDVQKSRISTRLQLVAYAAQSNLNGYRPPYAWSKMIHDACRRSHLRQSTYVLMDAASYLTSGRLDLTNASEAPDFITMSFYKIFGFPDLGALLIKKSAFDVMTHRRYFGGGTVDTVTVLGGAFHGSKRESLHDFLEDGTLPFHNIIALNHAIPIHQNLFQTAAEISRHVTRITAWLHAELSSLKHFNNLPVVDIYQDKLAKFGNASFQGPILAFNILKSDGSFVGKSHVESMAVNCGFQIRTGGVCNPGGIATMLQLEHWELMRNFTEGVRCGGDIDLVGSKPTGICRVSLGPMSTMSDVIRFARFVKHFFVETKASGRISVLHKIVGDNAPKNVTPIEGCKGYSVPRNQYSSHHLWNGKWCIVDRSTGEQIVAPQILEQLSVTVHTHSETLQFAHYNGMKAAMNLWDLPTTLITASSRESGLVFHTFDNPNINRWLSTNLGLECALATYSQDLQSQAANTTICTLSSCGLKFQSMQELRRHYTMHARDFPKVDVSTSKKCKDAPKEGRKSWKLLLGHGKQDGSMTFSSSLVVSATINPVVHWTSKVGKKPALVNIVELRR